MHISKHGGGTFRGDCSLECIAIMHIVLLCMEMAYKDHHAVPLSQQVTGGARVEGAVLVSPRYPNYHPVTSLKVSSYTSILLAV